MNKIKLMINGLPGNVAEIICRHAVADPRFHVLPFSLTGPDITKDSHEVEGVSFTLIKPGDRAASIGQLIETEGLFITVDYTHPTAVNANTEFYCAHSLPFVMGTTGGDRKAMHDCVIASAIPAVISPNMAKQIVGLMAMMEYAAENFPGLFTGYAMDVKESHQSWKADTSGTAKAMIGYFNRLGVEFTEEDIQMERDPFRQKNLWGIPDEYLDGHGWHTYTLDSADRTTRFAITHNISGREIYAEGTLDAVVYLADKVNEGVRGRVYSMIDVLKNN
jgi:4-hydroxy-tetrahydrodipicolinate reductase